MKNKIIIFMTIFSIMFISVAWSSFSTTLMITGEGTILTDSTPPTCGAWKLRPSTLTYAEATAQDAFINPGTNTTWRNATLILSVDCTDNTQCAFDHYDVKTYNTTTKTDSNALTQVIQDAFSNQTTCTLPVGGSNPYVDKDAPVLTELYVTPMDGEFKTSMNLIDVSTYPAFENIDGAYYTYEGNSFRGTSLNNMIIATNIIGRAQYATQDTSTGTDANGYPIFESMPATTMASSYCTGCRLPTYNEIGYVEDSVEVVEGYPYTNSGYEYTEYSYFLTPAHINKMGTYSVDIAVGQSLSDLYISGTMVTNEAGIRPVVDVPNGLTMSGSGTQADPYVILPANTRPTVYTGYEQSGIVSTQFYYKRCGDQNWTALTKNTFAATTTKAYTDWYIPSNRNSSTTCLSSAWGTYYFRIDTEDAAGNTKTYYSKNNNNSTPISGFTDDESQMNQIVLAPLKAKNITYDNTGVSTNCTNLGCALFELDYMFGTRQPGLYDEDYKMVKTWAELEALGLTKSAIETDYTFSNYDQNALSIFINNNLKGNLVIPEDIGLTKIGDWAFGLNSSFLSNLLTSVVIPNGVQTIGKYAFKNNGALENVTIPNGVTTIGYSAFGRTGLTSVTIPSSVTSIYAHDSSGSVFDDCWKLTSIKVDPDNPVYDSRNNSNAIIETSTNKLIAGSNNTVIPNSVTSIGAYAFSNRRMSSINIPNSVTSIGRFAFYGVGTLTSITIPNSITNIESEAFRSTGLTSVTIPSSVTNINGNPFVGCNQLTSIKVDSNNPVYDSRNNSNAIIKTSTNELVSGCKNTVIPNTVVRIGTAAFERHTGLTSITIPNSVTSIGTYAFYACSGLTSITIPSSVTEIGMYIVAEYENSGLQRVIFNNQSGWFVTTNQSATSGTAIDVTDPVQNATNMKTTYDTYYWKRN